MDAAFVILPIFVVLAIALAAVQFGRGRRILDDWAKDGGYAILDSERRSLRRGPFSFTTAKGQAVFRVTATDSCGATRTGFVRVGGRLFGTWSDAAEVRWDAEPRPPCGFPVLLRESADRQDDEARGDS